MRPRSQAARANSESNSQDESTNETVIGFAKKAKPMTMYGSLSNIRGPSNFGSTTTLQNHRNNAVNEKINRKPIKLDDEMPFDFSNEDQFNSSSHNHNASLSNNASTVNLRRPPAVKTTPPPPPPPQHPSPNKRLPKKIDLSKQTSKQKPDDVASIRIRDPVTSKVRTIYLKDSQIEELSKRHLEDKNKVEKAFGGGADAPTHAKPPSPASFNSYNQFQAFANSKMTSPPPPPPPGNMYNDIPSTPSSTKSYKKPRVQQPCHEDNTDKPSTRHDTISHNPLSYDSDLQQHDNQDDVAKLIERHQAERLKVNEFEASPYVPQEVEDELSTNINYESQSLDTQNQAPEIDHETGQTTN